MIKESDINEEIRKEYAKSPISITLWPDRVTKNFTGLAELYNFLEKEMTFWQSVYESRKTVSRVQNIYNNISFAHRRIQGIVNGKDISILSQRSFPEAKQYLINTGDSTILYSTSKAVRELANICASGQYSDTYVQNYVFYLQRRTFSDENYQGQIGAYMALNPSSSTSHNAKLKQFLDETIEETQSLVSKAEQEQTQYWEKAKGDYEKELAEIKTRYDDFYTQRQEDQERQAKAWDGNLGEAKWKLRQLEELYQEKLSLEAPAQHWKKLEKAYNTKGIIWTVLAVIFTLALCTGLVQFLFILPPSLVGSIDKFIEPETIRATLILTVAVSVCVYILRLFVKYATSAFHLSRDAKERYTLAILYLSLVEGKHSVAEKDREIILQSLFSRADTGLLKGDSSPSFPDGSLTSIIQGCIRGK